MKDITALCYELRKKNKGEYDYRKEVFKELCDMISEENKKGTDLSPYLEVKFNLLKMKYEITLELPPASFFNSGVSDGK